MCCIGVNHRTFSCWVFTRWFRQSLRGWASRGSRRRGKGLPMSSEIAIKVENLSKCYQIYDQPRDRLKQFVLPRMQSLVGLQPKQYYRDFWALKDVSFEVKKDRKSTRLNSSH